MFPTMKFWGARKRSASASNRRKNSLRFEPLESRQLLAVLTPNPIVSAGFVGNDLIVNGSAPEISVKINESGGLITVQGLTQQFLGTDGNYDLVTTDVNNSGMDTATFPAASLRDLKVQLSGSDSFLQIGDVNDPLTVGRDLIVSMPANTTAANLLKAGIASTSYLNLDVDSVTVPRNMTITIGQNTNYEAAVIDITNDIIGSSTETGTLTLRTYGAEPNMIGISSTTVVGNASVTTANGNDFVSIIGVDVTGRLTISVGDGNNTVLVDNDFTEVVDSSLQTYVISNPIFGDGLGDGELISECVAQLASDLNTASTLTDTSVTAQNLDIYSVGVGNDLVDVNSALISGGNLVISTSGSGVHLVGVMDTTVTSSTTSSLVGNVTITGGSGNELVYIDGLSVSGLLSVNPGSGNDVVIADPDVAGAADAAITDFVANNPGVFFDPTNPSSPGLDINDLVAKILDLSAPSSFDATKATFTTTDGVTGGGSIIDISLANVALSLSVTEGSAADDYLDINETKVGTTATVTQGNGADDTAIIVGVGGRAAGDTTNGTPTAEMTQFTLKVGNGTDDTVVVSLDYQGDPGYAYGPAYGIAAADAAYIANNPSVANTIGAIDADLDFAAEAQLLSSSPYSLNADRVSITTGNGGDLLTLSDICISTSLTNRLTVTLGTGDNYLYFYDNCWDGFANLSGGGNSTTTLDEDRGGNTEDNITVVGFPNVVPPLFPPF
jgi:hypothetical protein